MKKIKSKPPVIVSWLLKRFSKYDDDKSLNGDFDEEYFEIVKEKGKILTWFWYWFSLFSFIAFFIKRFNLLEFCHV